MTSDVVGPGDEFAWRKSTFSGGAGDCVELATARDGRRLMRDSKHPFGDILAFSAEAMAAFVAAVKAGEFDTPS